jgi:hypothetical protein
MDSAAQHGRAEHNDASDDVYRCFYINKFVVCGQSEPQSGITDIKIGKLFTTARAPQTGMKRAKRIRLQIPGLFNRPPAGAGPGRARVGLLHRYVRTASSMWQ